MPARVGTALRQQDFIPLITAALPTMNCTCRGARQSKLAGGVRAFSFFQERSLHVPSAAVEESDWLLGSRSSGK
eukprot:s2867_g3.t1